MYKTIRIIIILLSSILGAQAQVLQGTVEGLSENGTSEALPGASLRWLESTAIFTSTDADGRFKIALPPAGKGKLIASFVGYKTDTIGVNSDQLNLRIKLSEQLVLQEVEIKAKQDIHSMMNPAQSQVITSRELTKAACCNLSESFETNATVEVSQSDAVTGAKQIQMLGLDGVYTLMTLENYPTLRGLSVPYRLSFISGTWLEGIDIIKGMGSVINGYESMSGQINVRLKNPLATESIYFNQYVNSQGKFDTNLNLARPVGKRLHGTLLLHADHLGNQVDRNGDNFMDQPLATQFSGFSKWKYQSKGRLEGEYGIGALRDTRTGGQISSAEPQAGYGLYRTSSTIERVEGYAKTGLVSSNKPYQSGGLILSGSHHVQKAVYGLRPYDATQSTLYTNFIFQSIIGTTNHNYKAGLSYQHDRFRETFQDSAFGRVESVPGAFVEYVYKGNERLTLVTGLRGDYHNRWGFFATPRLNVKYDLSENAVIRLAAGRGFRTSNPIAENTGMLVSSRRFVFTEVLEPEIAWNYGASLTRKFKIGNRPATLVADYYYTDFQNQVVVDAYTDASQLRFGNLHGRSFSHSAQVEASVEVLERLELKAAYKFYDVRSTYNGQLLQRQFNSRHRLFFNAGYATNFEKWKFDVTANWFGRKPIPHDGFTTDHSRAYLFSKPFVLMNGQITKAFLKWDVYLGGENLLNFRQPNPIVNAANPFDPAFDAGMIWAPVTGRVIYAGVRLKIK